MNLKNVKTIALTQTHDGRHAHAGGVEGDTTMSETQENIIYTDVLEDFSPESVSHFRLGDRESTTLQWVRSYWKYMGLHDFTMNLKNVETIALTQTNDGRHAQAGGVEGDTTMSETQENSTYIGVLEDFSPESVSHFRLSDRESTTLQ